MEEEELLVLANLAMIALGGLLEQLLVLFEGLSDVSMRFEKRKDHGQIFVTHLLIWK